MIVGQLTSAELGRRLVGKGLGIRTGPFGLRVRSDIAAVRDGLGLLYQDYPLVEDQGFCDYAIELLRPPGLRRWIKPQVRMYFDHAPLFEPMPLGHAMPLLEWALNWCISAHAHQYLILHAAAIEREGFAAILPAPPGSGKSTLCAGLIHRGWRLLSDELALLSLADGSLHALARPVSLKNRSIDIIRQYASGSVFGALSRDTAKGTVAHLKVSQEHLVRVHETARPAWIVFPHWVADSPPQLVPRGKPETVLAISRQTFNFGLSGREGFHALADAVSVSDCYDFSYSRLDDAVEVFDGLVRARHP
jgi:HprK-related kinase A